MLKEKLILLNQYFYVHIGKSFKAKKDNDLIKFGESYSKVDIQFEKIDREGNISVEINDKKTFFTYIFIYLFHILLFICGKLFFHFYWQYHINIITIFYWFYNTWRFICSKFNINIFIIYCLQGI